MSTDNQTEEIKDTEGSDDNENRNQNDSQQAEAKSSEETSNSDNQATDSFEAKYNELNDKYLRLYSEFDNFRRRTAKEKLTLISTASSDLMRELLPILDDTERAINTNKDSNDLESIKQGFQLLNQKLSNTLKSKGLKEMQAKEETFDPELHEAITKIPAPDKKLKGKVVDVIEKGYYLNETVIRYAKVVVGE
ncbi:MAG: nucleotide exchange factor GrpE [Flavobacteriales bacterium]|nr:nucleotide exchange factor GrpE [Flavobacteriales bacterium]